MEYHEVLTLVRNLRTSEQHLLVSEIEKGWQKKSGEEFMRCKQVFCELYFSYFGTKYYWQGKDSGSLTQLINKIKAKMEEAPNTRMIMHAEAVANNFQVFIRRAMKLPDEWLKNNFTVAVINSQFNSIYARLKKGNHTDNLSDDYRRRLIDRLCE